MTKPRPRQAVILAGGKGTRLRPITETVPKPMVPFHDRPFLDYLLDMLREQGFERVLLLLGYLPDVIVDHVGDGSRYGLEVTYDVTAPEDLTAYRVQHAADRLDPVFVLMYCDNYWPMRFDDMWASFLRSGAPAQITVYSNADGFSRDSVRVGEGGWVEAFDRSRTAPNLAGVEISYAILERDAVLPLLPDHQELFEVAVYPPLVERGLLHAYWTEHRYYSVGNLERLPITGTFLARRPAVILDRDGVLNARPPKAEYIETPEDFRWLPGALESLRRFNEAGWRVIVVSNQAGVGRGVMTKEDLAAVDEKMRREAEAAGGRIDASYYCTHDWDAGCSCRKPEPGMLFQAQREFHLDLTRTCFIGDDERDRETARRAGARSVLVTEQVGLLDLTHRLLAGEPEVMTL